MSNGRPRGNGVRGQVAQCTVQAFGHEAAHAMGIDIIRGIVPTHYNAERSGLDVMRHFCNKYE